MQTPLDIDDLTNHQIRLRQRPRGLVKAGDFDFTETRIPELADGEALMRTIYLGMDATVRTWLNKGEGYLPMVEIGEVVRCSGIGVIVATNCEAYDVGDVTYSLPGWQEYAICRDDLFTTKLPPGTDMPSTLSIYGGTGATAYFGMLDIGEPREGETVVVSAAAGATGSIAGQVAKLQGCRVVGISGSDEKCKFVTEELGFDACINHRTDDISARLAEYCPDRVDVYFDNVGGPILDAVLGHLNTHGRVVLCGAISVYNEKGKPPGPTNYVNLISRRGSMRGFIALDWVDRFPDAALQLAEWVEEGKLTYREHYYESLEEAPAALNALFTGENTGKVIVRLSEE